MIDWSMRRQKSWVGLAISLASLAACNVFEARSGEFECTLPSECVAPRSCQMGYCVEPGGAMIDADPLAPDADPNQPDADPNQPDARSLPDADPDRPDAAGCNQGPTIPFSDNFNDNSIDTRWTESAAGTGTASEANGRVELALQTSPPTGNAVFETKAPGFDMTGRRIFVEVPQVVANDGITRFRIFLDANHHALIRQRNDSVLARIIDGAGGVEINSVAYNSTQQRWWQFRHSGGALEFEVSPDGINWVSLGSTPTPSFIDDVRIELRGSTMTNNVAPGASHFDNLNVLPGCP